MMKRQDRAKQFLPFDAMKGLTEALREREERHARTVRREIGEEQKEAKSRVLAQIEKGMRVEVECYHAFHDTVLEGIVWRISLPYHFIRIEEKRIAFEDIYAIRIKDYI